jgi:hypothetical protein
MFISSPRTSQPRRLYFNPRKPPRPHPSSGYAGRMVRRCGWTCWAPQCTMPAEGSLELSGRVRERSSPDESRRSTLTSRPDHTHDPVDGWPMLSVQLCSARWPLCIRVPFFGIPSHQKPTDSAHPSVWRTHPKLGCIPPTTVPVHRSASFVMMAWDGVSPPPKARRLSATSL